MKKWKKIVAVVLIVVITFGAIAVIKNFTDMDPEEPKAESKKEQTNKTDGKVLLELEYVKEGESTSSTATIRFYDDRTFTCEAVASSLYEVDYSTAYDAQDGLKIETVKEYTSHVVEEGKSVVKLMGLPTKLTFDVVHLVEENKDGGVTLTIQTDTGNAKDEPAVIGVYELSKEQLKDLADATKGVKAPKEKKQDKKDEEEEEDEDNAGLVNLDTSGFSGGAPATGDISFDTASGTCTLPGVYFVTQNCRFYGGAYTTTYRCDKDGNLSIDQKYITVQSDDLAMVFMVAGMTEADAKAATTMTLQAQHEVVKTADGASVTIWILNPDNGERYNGGSFTVSNAQLDQIRGTQGEYRPEPEPKPEPEKPEPDKPVKPIVPEGDITFDIEKKECAFPALAFAYDEKGDIVFNAKPFTTGFTCDAYGNLVIKENKVQFYSEGFKEFLKLVMGMQGIQLSEEEVVKAATQDLPMKYAVTKKGDAAEIAVSTSIVDEETGEKKVFDCGKFTVTAEQMAALTGAAPQDPNAKTGTLKAASLNFIHSNCAYQQTTECQTTYTSSKNGISIKGHKAVFSSDEAADMLYGLSMVSTWEDARKASEITADVSYICENGILKATISFETVEEGVPKTYTYTMDDYALNADVFNGSEVSITLPVKEKQPGWPAVPGEYWNNVETGGDIERQYMAKGTHEVGYVEYPEANPYKKYGIYYPVDMSGATPAVVFVNGTGIRGSQYADCQKHMASWGFITIAVEQDFSWRGDSAEMCVQELEKLNVDPNSVLYGKIATGNIGIVGHSQGGYGVVNAITVQPNMANYQAAVILSSTPSAADGNFGGWKADPSRITIPTMVLAGENDGLAPLEGLQDVYNKIPENVDKVLARRAGADHGQLLYSGDGYVTAWFMWKLQGDTTAAGAFDGDDAEIFKNALYKDRMYNMGNAVEPEIPTVEIKGEITLDTENKTAEIPNLSFVHEVGGTGYPFIVSEEKDFTYNVQDGEIVIPSADVDFYSEEADAGLYVVGAFILQRPDAAEWAHQLASPTMNVSFVFTVNDDGSAFVDVTAKGNILGDDFIEKDTTITVGRYTISKENLDAALGGTEEPDVPETPPAEVKGEITLNTESRTAVIPKMSVTQEGATPVTFTAVEEVNPLYSVVDGKLNIATTEKLKFYSPEFQAFLELFGTPTEEAKAAATPEMEVSYTVTAQADGSALVAIKAINKSDANKPEYEVGTYSISAENMKAALETEPAVASAEEIVMEQSTTAVIDETPVTNETPVTTERTETKDAEESENLESVEGSSQNPESIPENEESTVISSENTDEIAA